VTLTPSDARDASSRGGPSPVGTASETAVAPGPVERASDDEHRSARPAPVGSRHQRWLRWPVWATTEVSDDGPLPRPFVLVVLITVALGVVLRFVTRSDLWLDEALSVSIASLPLSEIPEALRHDGHPPLYYVLLHGWSRLLGTGDVAVRSLSGIISALTLPLAYLAGRRAGGRLLGLLTLVTLAVSPFALRYATEARMYALVSLLVLVGYLLIDDIVRRSRGGAIRLAALAVCTGALLWTHYWGIWLVGATVVVLAWLWRRGGSPELRRASARATGAVVAGGVLFLPWLPSMLYQAANTGTPWAGPVRPTTLVAVTLTDFGGGAVTGSFMESQLLGGLLLVLALLGLFGVARGRHRIELDLRTVPQFRVEAIVVAVAVLIAVVVMYASGSAFMSRYASAFHPLVLLIVAGGLSRFRDLRILGGVLVIVLGLSAIGAAFNVRTDRTQAGRLAEHLATTAVAGDLVVYCPDQLAPAALRVFPAGLEHVGFPHRPAGAWPTDRIDWVDYAERSRTDPKAYARDVSAHAPDRQLFVVYNSSYQTHREACEILIHEISLERGSPGMLAVAESTYYESAGLARFGPRQAG
jgi:mannosyltransferase